MAILDITEYVNVTTLPNHSGQAPIEPALLNQQLTISGAAAVSAQFQAGTRMVRLHCDTPCRWIFSIVGSSTNASSTSPRMAQNQTEYHGVPEGGSYVVSVISSS